jgi:hypothetical protein
MRLAFPEALITFPDDLLEVCKNHQDDRHVLAVAIVAGAEVIVTENLDHFPAEAFDALGCKRLFERRFVALTIRTRRITCRTALERTGRGSRKNSGTGSGRTSKSCAVICRISYGAPGRLSLGARPNSKIRRPL